LDQLKTRNAVNLQQQGTIPLNYRANMWGHEAIKKTTKDL
jgi:hypothetical protein